MTEMKAKQIEVSLAEWELLGDDVRSLLRGLVQKSMEEAISNSLENIPPEAYMAAPYYKGSGPLEISIDLAAFASQMGELVFNVPLEDIVEDMLMFSTPHANIEDGCDDDKRPAVEAVSAALRALADRVDAFLAIGAKP